MSRPLMPLPPLDHYQDPNREIAHLNSFIGFLCNENFHLQQKINEQSEIISQLNLKIIELLQKLDRK